jgi:hypothetical protein
VGRVATACDLRLPYCTGMPFSVANIWGRKCHQGTSPPPVLCMGHQLMYEIMWRLRDQGSDTTRCSQSATFRPLRVGPASSRDGRRHVASKTPSFPPYRRVRQSGMLLTVVQHVGTTITIRDLWCRIGGVIIMAACLPEPAGYHCHRDIDEPARALPKTSTLSPSHGLSSRR